MSPALIWTLLAASIVVGLAALGRMADPATLGGSDGVTGAIRLPELVTVSIVGLFTLALLVLLVDVVRRLLLRRREPDDTPPGEPAPPASPWLRALTQLVSFAYFVALAYLLWRQGMPLAGMMLGQAGDSANVPAFPEMGAAPPVVTWTFGILGLAAGLGALALALSVAFSDRLASWWQKPAEDDSAVTPLAHAVEESLADVRAEPDARRAIIRCYARFERVAGDSGLARKPWLTPMEFMREALERWPVPRAAVPTLTGLFELARFSQRVLGPAERDRALDALDEIKAAIEEGRGGAGAS